ELHAHAVREALQAARLHQAADAEGAPVRHLVRGDLRRGEKEHQVLAEGAEDEGGGDRQGREAAGDHGEALVPRLHRVLGSWRSASERRRRASTTISATRRTSVTP